MFDRPQSSNKSITDFSADWVREETFSQLYKFPGSTEIPKGTPDLTIDMAQKTAGSGKERSEQRIEGRFETAEIVAAVESSRDKNIPLLAQVGVEWCSHCRHMEKDIWPQLEGKNGLPEKAVVLHLDYEKSEGLKEEALELANKVKDGVSGFPSYKIFAPGTVENPIASHSGELTVAELKTFLKSGNVIV